MKVWDKLPKKMEELKDVIGRTATLKMVDNFGGLSLFIPIKIKPNSRIHVAIGPEKAELLSGYYGGCQIHIPKLDSLKRSVRDSEIVHKRKNGFSVAELSRGYDLTQRQIYSILKVTKCANFAKKN